VFAASDSGVPATVSTRKEHFGSELIETQSQLILSLPALNVNQALVWASNIRLVNWISKAKNKTSMQLR
jgi:hypothetical protein